jgi:exosortase/archaeosortase family protein
VTADGTRLVWAASAVDVDAPCAGVRMLWTALVVGLAACAAARSGWKPTAGVMAAVTGVVVAGNAVRAAALFYLEAGIVHGPAWAHEGTGLLVFAATALAALAVAPARRPSCAA